MLMYVYLLLFFFVLLAYELWLGYWGYWEWERERASAHGVPTKQSAASTATHTNQGQEATAHHPCTAQQKASMAEIFANVPWNCTWMYEIRLPSYVYLIYIFFSCSYILLFIIYCDRISSEQKAGRQNSMDPKNLAKNIYKHTTNARRRGKRVNKIFTIYDDANDALHCIFTVHEDTHSTCRRFIHNFCFLFF